jgi:hypothetical protein
MTANTISSLFKILLTKLCTRVQFVVNITPSKLPSDCIADPRVPGLSPPFAVIKVNYLLEGRE